MISGSGNSVDANPSRRGVFELGNGIQVSSGKFRAPNIIGVTYIDALPFYNDAKNSQSNPKNATLWDLDGSIAGVPSRGVPMVAIYSHKFLADGLLFIGVQW